MKKHLLLVAALAAGIAVNAQYTQELPLDYEDFFRAEAIAESGTALERGVYATNTQGSGVIMVDQWNNGGKSSDKAGESPVLQANTLSYDAYIDNLQGKEIVLANLPLRGVLLIHKFECKPFRKSRSFGISRPS